MLEPTYSGNAIEGAAEPQAGFLFHFSGLQKKPEATFLLRKSGPQQFGGPNETVEASPESQSLTPATQTVRIPPVNASKRRVKVLQRWTGRVERVMAHSFVAIISDNTNPSNPQEEIELDLEEVSLSDLSMVHEGAAFYWSMGYQDTDEGQRLRVAILRFARQPALSQSDIDQIFEEADEITAILESA